MQKILDNQTESFEVKLKEKDHEFDVVVSDLNSTHSSEVKALHENIIFLKEKIMSLESDLHELRESEVPTIIEERSERRRSSSPLVDVSSYETQIRHLQCELDTQAGQIKAFQRQESLLLRDLKHQLKKEVIRTKELEAALELAKSESMRPMSDPVSKSMLSSTNPSSFFKKSISTSIHRSSSASISDSPLESRPSLSYLPTDFQGPGIPPDVQLKIADKFTDMQKHNFVLKEKVGLEDNRAHVSLDCFP
jgi:hypothetical protein